MTWVSDVIHALKSPPKVIAAVAIPSGLLVLAPDSWLARLGLNAFMTLARPYVSLVFIVTSSTLPVECLWSARDHVAKRLRRRNALARLKERIEALDPAERIVLREFFIQGQSTIKLPMDQPVVAALIQKQIIQQVGRLGEKTVAGMTFSFRVRDEALDTITPQLLGLPMEPTLDDKKRIIAERPPYIVAILQHDELCHSPLWP